MLVIVVLLLLASLFVIKKTPNILNPASLMAVIWDIQIIIALAISDLCIMEWSGIIYIQTCVLLFQIGYNSFGVKVKDPLFSPCFDKHTINVRLIVIITLISFCLSIVYITIGYIKSGHSFSDLFNLSSLLAMNNENSTNRYNESENKTVVESVLLVFVYLTPLLAGFILCLVKTKVKPLCVLSLVPNIFVAITKSEKMPLLTGIMLIFVGIMVARWIFGIEFRFSLKKTLILAVVGIVMAILLYFSMLLRTGRINPDIAHVIAQKFGTYSVGHLSAFSQWFQEANLSDVKHYYGMRVFMGITSPLGLVERTMGLYTEKYYVFGNPTNVFTIFRMLVEDFGESLTLLVMLLGGIFTKFVFFSLARKRMIWLSGTVLSAIYFSILWSFVTSVFVYSSYLLMFALFSLILALLFFHKEIITKLGLKIGNSIKFAENE